MSERLLEGSAYMRHEHGSTAGRLVVVVLVVGAVSEEAPPASLDHCVALYRALEISAGAEEQSLYRMTVR